MPPEVWDTADDSVVVSNTVEAVTLPRRRREDADASSGEDTDDAADPEEARSSASKADASLGPGAGPSAQALSEKEQALKVALALREAGLMKGTRLEAEAPKSGPKLAASDGKSGLDQEQRVAAPVGISARARAFAQRHNHATSVRTTARRTSFGRSVYAVDSFPLERDAHPNGNLIDCCSDATL